MLLEIEPIEKLFQKLEKCHEEARQNLGRGLTLVEKILFSHMEDKDYSKLERGVSNIFCNPDRVAMQDATAQMAILQFMSAQMPQVAGCRKSSITDRICSSLESSMSANFLCAVV